MNPRLALGITTLLGCALGIALMQEPAPGPSAIAQAAARFLDGLSPELRHKATAPLGDPSRTQWNFVPMEYPGVAFAELDANQRAAARALLRSVLSAPGMAKVEAIMALESVLAQIE